MAEDKKQVEETYLRDLRHDYEIACDAYVDALCDKWRISDGWWVNDEIGGSYIFLDTESLRMDEIILCVENDISIDEYFEWSEYNTFAHDFNQNIISIKAWHMGYHGIPKEERDALYKLRQDFEETCKQYKSKY